MDIPPLGAGPHAISPTDVSQFIRIEQCERYLRLRLHERNVGSGFMREFGVVPQSIPPLLTQAGADFENEIERAVDATYTTSNCAAQLAQNVPQVRKVDERTARSIARWTPGSDSRAANATLL